MPSLLDAIADRVRAGRPYTDMGGMHDDPPSPPASPAEVAVAEARLGFALPPLLRDIYLHVANGGFGPGYGLYGIERKSPIYAGAVQEGTTGATRHATSEKLLLICTWGCEYFSYIDCIMPQAPVMAIDTNSHGHGPGDCAFSLHAASFEEWMRRWMDGEDLWQSIGLYGAPKFWFEENKQA